MLNKDELASYAQMAAMRMVADLQDLMTSNPADPTPDEAEAVLNGIIYVCGALEAYLMACVPEKGRYNIRTALEHMSNVMAKRLIEVIKPKEGV